MDEGKRSEPSVSIDEVLLAYGRAVYAASCLERKIAMIISGNDRSGMDTIGRERYTFFLEDNAVKRFQSLMDRLSQKIQLSSRFETELRESLSVRNRLLHGYWWERDRDMETSAGRSNILDELTVFSNRFGNLISYLEAGHA